MSGPAGLRLLNGVVLAEDFERLRDWWIEVVGLEPLQQWSDAYHYAELGSEGRLVVGIADAKEMETTLSTPRANAVIVQLRVDDVQSFLASIKDKGGKVTFGPSFEESEKFWFGGFEDGEGNAVWVVTPPSA